MKLKLLAMLVGVFAASIASNAHAGLIVTGMETSAGNYKFTFSQDGSTDPIQNKGNLTMQFVIDMPGITIFSPAGNLTDGTTTMSPTLFGWIAPLSATTFDPNLVTDLNSGPLTMNADAGIDFNVTDISWRFVVDTSPIGLSGTVQGINAIPEPGAAVVWSLMALVGLASQTRRRKK